jgi:CrcB protein
MRDWVLAVLLHPATLLTVGGAAGTNARYWLWRSLAAQAWARDFPVATLLINVSGSLLLALLALSVRQRLPWLYVLLGVGFCGGYTTFSTFAVETVELARNGHVGFAVLYVAASVLLSVGLASVLLLQPGR